MTSALDAQALAIDAVAQAQQDQLRNQLLASLIVIYGLSNLTASHDSLFNLVRMMVPAYLGAQRTMVALTTTTLQRITQTPILTDTDSNIGHNLRGVPVETVLMRSFDEVAYQLDRGRTPPEAFTLGRERLVKTALTDLQLAKTHASRDFIMKLQLRLKDQTVGYRRVLSSKPNHCALCILASTRRYRSDELMPIHPGCGCGIEPIFNDEDPAASLDSQRAVDLHEAVRRDLGEDYVQAGGKTYRDILVTHDHGELGPVLAVRGHHFEGPDVIGHVRVNPEDVAQAPRQHGV